ncbi:hypothetical protein [Janibacter alittae]|uniref:Hemerythrin-like domain-containing protein n=1 Tax=Janibacter alittae TaxID=3115209 RepID=A0ABZ2MHM8_9MICO
MAVATTATLGELVTEAAGVHGDRHPELGEVQEVYGRVVAELEPHMTREERAVFPARRSWSRTCTSTSTRRTTCSSRACCRCRSERVAPEDPQNPADADVLRSRTTGALLSWGHGA